MKSSREQSLVPRLRVHLGDEIALGPGRVELIRLVHQTGSITEAAKRMGMSYMRAWTLIRDTNRCFQKPLVTAVRGGKKGGGGAILSPLGLGVMALYDSMHVKCLKATRSEWMKLQKILLR